MKRFSSRKAFVASIAALATLGVLAGLAGPASAFTTFRHREGPVFHCFKAPCVHPPARDYQRPTPPTTIVCITAPCNPPTSVVPQTPPTTMVCMQYPTCSPPSTVVPPVSPKYRVTVPTVAPTAKPVAIGTALVIYRDGTVVES